MALQFQKEVEDTGLFLSYHRVTHIIFEIPNDFVELRIGLYSNMNASQGGKDWVREYNVKIPMDIFKGAGSLLDIAYNALKTLPEFQEAVDV